MSMIETIDRFPDWQRYLVILVIPAILIGVFWKFTYIPKTEQITKLDQEITKLQEQINKAIAIEAKLDEFQKKFAILQNQLKLVREILPSKDEMEKLLVTIEGLATYAGLEVSVWDPMPEISKGFYKQMPNTLRASGGYHEIGKFFEKISNEERIVTIGNIDLKTARSRGGASEVALNCQINAFYAPEKTAPETN